MKNSSIILRKRFQSILEVLIAFVLIVLCILPLIYPYVAIYKEETRFIKRIELDHVVNLLYANILEKLYLNKILWADLEHRSFSVDKGLLNEAQYEGSFAFIGSYNFFEDKDNYPRFKPPKKGSPLSIYLYRLTFNFLPIEFQNSSEKIKEEKMIKYKYDVYVVRDLK